VIKYFTVTNEDGETLKLSIHDGYNPSHLLVVNSDGLGSPTTTINTLISPNKDGTTVNKKRAEPRTIELQIAVTTRVPSLEEAARLSLYRFFPSKGVITLGVSTLNRDIVIDAEVEENPVSPFASIENTKVQLYCPDPYFRSATETQVVLGKIVNSFEFPFSNDSLTEDLITFGEILTTPHKNVFYEGSQPTGITIKVNVDSPISTDLNLYNTVTNQTMTLDWSTIESIIGGASQTGDYILINTRLGQKAVSYVRGATSWNILNSLGYYTDWINMVRGQNQYTYDLSGGALENITVTLTYETLYDGV
jgi:hypothetical protein